MKRDLPQKEECIQVDHGIYFWDENEVKRGMEIKQ